MNPTYYDLAALRLKRLSRSFGIAAIVSAFLFLSIPYLAIGFGALSILFGVLSKGYGEKLPKDSKTGVTLASIALCISLVVTVGSFALIFTSDETKEELYEYARQMDEDTNGLYEEAYGVSMEDMMKQFFTGGKE